LVQIGEIKSQLPPPPFWLEYLRFRQDWSFLGPISRVEFTHTKNGGFVALHRPDQVNDMRGCLCNTVTVLNVIGPNITEDPMNHYSCMNAFLASGHNNHIYTVFDKSTSYNTT